MVNKKILYILFAMVIIFGVIFILQIKKTSGIIVRPNEAPLVNSQPNFIPLNQTDPAIGNPGAAISITEFGSIGCKECARVNDILYKFVTANPAKTQLVWKDAPTPGIFFGGNLLAHQAAYCAGKQSKFWQFLNLAMIGSDWTSKNGLKKIANQLKMDELSWWQCVNSPETEKKMLEAIDAAATLNIRSTPALFINNKTINLNTKVNLEDLLNKLIE